MDRIIKLSMFGLIQFRKFQKTKSFKKQGENLGWLVILFCWDN